MISSFQDGETKRGVGIRSQRSTNFSVRLDTIVSPLSRLKGTQLTLKNWEKSFISIETSPSPITRREIGKNRPNKLNF